MTAISQGAPNCSWITFSNRAPAIAPGMVPTTSAHAIRSSGVDICLSPIEWNHARAYRMTS